MFIEYFVSTLIIGLFLIKFYIIGHLGQVLVSKFERFQIIDYTKLRIFEKIFVGFFISIQLLYLNHFLFNLNYNFRFAYFTIFFIIGILLFMINYKLLKKSLANEKFLSLVFLIILFLLTFVGKLTVKPTFVDSVATHIPLEKLFINNPIIFGLGNLDPYMGYGSPLSLVSAVYNFSLGTNEFRLTVFLFILMMLLITLSELLKGNKSILWKLTLIIYNLGVIFIAMAVWAVPRIGVLLFALISISGQLSAAVVLDIVLPTDGTELGAQLFIGIGLTFVAIALSTVPRLIGSRSR